MNKAKLLEQEMRGYKPKLPSGISFEGSETEPDKKGPRRRYKLRSIRFERAENGFIGNPEYEPREDVHVGEKSHVFQDVNGIHKFLDGYWRD